MRIDVVFLDVGGVIYSDNQYRLALHAALEELAEIVETPTFDAVYDDCRRMQAGSFRAALAQAMLGDARRAGELGAAAERHWTLPRSSLAPQASDVLRGLSFRYRLGIIANQAPVVHEALARDGIARLIDVWAISSDLGVEKPDRRIFRAALSLAATGAEHAVHVGNRLDNDIRPAKAVGLKTVWLLQGEAPDNPPQEQRREADYVIESLSELPAILTDLTRSEGSR